VRLGGGRGRLIRIAPARSEEGAGSKREGLRFLVCLDGVGWWRGGAMQLAIALLQGYYYGVGNCRLVAGSVFGGSARRTGGVGGGPRRHVLLLGGSPPRRLSSGEAMSRAKNR
jgi:hypothetical protein